MNLLISLSVYKKHASDRRCHRAIEICGAWTNYCLHQKKISTTQEVILEDMVKPNSIVVKSTIHDIESQIKKIKIALNIKEHELEIAKLNEELAGL